MSDNDQDVVRIYATVEEGEEEYDIQVKDQYKYEGKEKYEDINIDEQLGEKGEEEEAKV